MSSNSYRSWHPDCALWSMAAETMHKSYPATLLRSSSRNHSNDNTMETIAASPSLSSGDGTNTTPTNIPRILHYIWLGGTVPKRLRQLVETWRILHPHWLHYLWEDKDIDKLFPFFSSVSLPKEEKDNTPQPRYRINPSLSTTTFAVYNSSAFFQSTNLGQRSDILRYELLYSFGGVYVDMDMLGVSTFDTLCRESDFFIGISNAHNSWELNNAVIGSVPGHPLLRQLIEAIHNDYSTEGSVIPLPPSSNLPLPIASSASPSSSSSLVPNFMDVILRTGPWFVTQQLMPTLLHAWGFTNVSTGVNNDDKSTRDTCANNANDSLLRTSQNLRQLYPEFLSTYLRTNTGTLESIPPLVIPPINGKRCRVLPKFVFYPLPNTVQIPPPEWTKDTSKENLHKLLFQGTDKDFTDNNTLCYWERERGRWQENLLLHAAPDADLSRDPSILSSVTPSLSESTQSWLTVLTGSKDIVQFIDYGTIGIHYWSRLWQRKEAQVSST